MNSFWATVAGIIGSFGGASLLVFLLSSWLGKLWANRIMEQDRSRYARELEELKSGLEIANKTQFETFKRELDIFQNKYLSAHHDKIATYRLAADSVARLLSDISGLFIGALKMEEMPNIVREFDRERLRLYGYMGMLAPQPVMSAYTSLTDYLIQVLGKKQEYKWEHVRELANNLLNEIRKDIGIDSTPIRYTGNA